MGMISAAAATSSMLSCDSERDCVAEEGEAGLGHLSTAWSSGNSSILVMEGELPRLAVGDGVDDDDEIAPSEDDLGESRTFCDLM